MRESLLSYCNFVYYETLNKKFNNKKKKTFKIYFNFCSRTMTAFYSIQFTVIPSKMSANQTLRHYQANLLFHRNIAAPISTMCFGIYVYACSIH